MNARFRLFIDPPLDGPTNMAVDDCLLNEALPTLRLYRWRPATLSLGYFQSFSDPARRRPELADLPVVRRITGGGAIVHADELTYSLTLPAGHPLAGDGPADLYTWMHARLADAVAALGGRTQPKGGNAPLGGRGGPFLCFRRHAPFDLMAGAEKLAGSAQRRTRTAVLQHGGVVLERTHPIQPSGAVAELVGRRVEFDEFAEALCRTIADTGIRLEAPRPTAADPARLELERRKHAGDDWLRRR